MQIILCDNYDEISERAADIVKAAVLSKPTSVLGLATGSTPEGMYRRLIQDYENGELDFSCVETFNLDEYYPLSADNEQSYHYYMNEKLFRHINVPESRIHILNGEASDPEAECKAYGDAIKAAGGIDLQILGIGENGHIGFNEPDDYLHADVHKTGLTESTVNANARFFATRDEVPRYALTVGIGDILRAKKILLLASGEKKAAAVRALLDDRITTANPASLLKTHADVVLICDRAAYGE